MSISKLPDEWHDLLHNLWSKATGCPGYVKADWMKLEQMLFQGAAAIAAQEAKRDPRSK